MVRCAHCQAETELRQENGIPICSSCGNAGLLKRKQPAAVTLHQTLIQSLLSSTARVNAAWRVFDEVIGYSSGLPHPDCSQRIRNASGDLEASRKELGRARNRLTEFLALDIINGKLKRRAAGQ
jgi:DNA-directed RNA polymerase subunit RPC12/RpoP